MRFVLYRKVEVCWVWARQSRKGKARLGWARLGWARQSRRRTAVHGGACPGCVGLVMAVMAVCVSVSHGGYRPGVAVADRLGAASQGLARIGSHGSASRVKAMRCTVRLGAAVSDGQRIAMVGSGSVRLGAVRLGSLGKFRSVADRRGCGMDRRSKAVMEVMG